MVMLVSGDLPTKKGEFIIELKTFLSFGGAYIIHDYINSLSRYNNTIGIEQIYS